MSRHEDTCPCDTCTAKPFRQHIESLERQLAESQRREAESKQSGDFWKAETIAQNTTIRELQQECKRLREALVFVRDYCEYRKLYSPICRDLLSTAMKALAAKEKP